MTVSERDRILQKIKSIDDKKWRSDKFDVRYYLISQIKNILNKKILDVGGGIGIISSELSENNFCVNLELDFESLKLCRKKNNSNINVICGSMMNLPFKNDMFDVVISAHIVELAKAIDLKQEKLGNLPNVNNLILEKNRVLKNDGILYLTTPNYVYNNGKNKLKFQELENVLSKFFSEFTILFYNTIPKISNKKKFNFSNMIPKIRSKFEDTDEIIKSLIKKESRNNFSVYFYAYAKK